MALLWFVAVALVVYFVARHLYKWWAPFHTPPGLKRLPGPKGLPLLGVIPWLKSGQQRPHEYFMRLRKQYGDIFIVPVGIRHVIVIHDIQLIRAAYAKVTPFFKPGIESFQQI